MREKNKKAKQTNKQETETEPKPTGPSSPIRTAHVTVHMTVGRTVVHNIAQINSSDNLPSYPPDNHHSSEDYSR